MVGTFGRVDEHLQSQRVPKGLSGVPTRSVDFVVCFGPVGPFLVSSSLPTACSLS